MPKIGQVTSSLIPPTPSPSPNGTPPLVLSGDGYAVPFWETTDAATVRLYCGHVLDILAALPERSVHMMVTSPPYWGLRDYGTGMWEGEDPTCDHIEHAAEQSVRASALGRKRDGFGVGNSAHQSKVRQYKNICGKCGARRIDLQIGSEPSPDCGTKGQSQCGGCFVCTMVAVFRGVRRVLRDDGTCWLNLGSSYGSNGQMVWTPALVAMALQADGWILRQDLIWYKPAPMPESLRNRCTKAHEYVFLLAKRPNYFYDAEAVKEDQSSTYSSSGFLPDSQKDSQGNRRVASVGASRSNGSTDPIVSGRNKRSVWTVDDGRALLDWLRENDPAALDRFLAETGERLDVVRCSSPGYAGAHFAVYPPELIRPMIRAGTSKYGACAECGAPWRRVIASERIATRPGERTKFRTEVTTVGGKDLVSDEFGHHDPLRHVTSSRTMGWEPTCSCFLGAARRCGECRADWLVEKEEPVGKDWNAKKRREGTTLALGQSRKDREDNEERIFSSNAAQRERSMPCECFLDRVVPCTVLDIFLGSGTTAAVCIEEGRRCVGIDLSAEYLTKNAIPRITGRLGSRPALIGLIPRKEGPSTPIRTMGMRLLGGERGIGSAMTGST